MLSLITYGQAPSDPAYEYHYRAKAHGLRPDVYSCLVVKSGSRQRFGSTSLGTKHRQAMYS
jgi:hypothetical protein